MFDSSFLPFITGIIGPVMGTFQLGLITFISGLNAIRNPPLVCYPPEDSRISKAKDYYESHCLYSSLDSLSELNTKDAR